MFGIQPTIHNESFFDYQVSNSSGSGGTGATGPRGFTGSKWPTGDTGASGFLSILGTAWGAIPFWDGSQWAVESDTLAIGTNAGVTQEQYSIAIGYNAGNNQGNTLNYSCLAIGPNTVTTVPAADPFSFNKIIDKVCFHVKLIQLVTPVLIIVKEKSVLVEPVEPVEQVVQDHLD